MNEDQLAQLAHAIEAEQPLDLAPAPLPPTAPEPVLSVIEEMIAAGQEPVRETDFADTQLATLDEVISTSDDEDLVHAAKAKRAVLVLEAILADAVEADQAAFQATASERAAEEEKVRLHDLHMQTRLDPSRVITQPTLQERKDAEAEAYRMANDPSWLAEQEARKVTNQRIDALLQDGKREEAEALAATLG